ncbi:MAG TPA: phytanoyl-CoA dioxygenase family protein [Cytophagaceae bacterium]|jgi:hypothetical protein|nr:phytanoyl-CoA dioxygenase family protein [Cytophagaceae bacterium]
MIFNGLSDTEVEKFWHDGFLLIKNVFTKDEISNFRRAAYDTLEESEKDGSVVKSPHGPAKIIMGDLLSKPKLKQVLLDDRIVKIASDILKAPLVYFGDSSMQIGLGARGMHKDNANRVDQNDSDWQGNYPIIRFGIYLQDHKKYSGGLKVKRCSHNYVSVKKGKTVLLDTEIGDVAVWSLRTTHSGNAVRLRFLPNLPLPVPIEMRLPSWLKQEEEQERVSFFLSYGIEDPRTGKFINFLKSQKWATDSLRKSKLESNVEEELKKKNIRLIKVIPEYGS